MYKILVLVMRQPMTHLITICELSSVIIPLRIEYSAESPKDDSSTIKTLKIQHAPLKRLGVFVLIRKDGWSEKAVGT